MSSTRAQRARRPGEKASSAKRAARAAPPRAVLRTYCASASRLAATVSGSAEPQQHQVTREQTEDGGRHAEGHEAPRQGECPVDRSVAAPVGVPPPHGSVPRSHHSPPPRGPPRRPATHTHGLLRRSRPRTGAARFVDTSTGRAARLHAPGPAGRVTPPSGEKTHETPHARLAVLRSRRRDGRRGGDVGRGWGGGSEPGPGAATARWAWFIRSRPSPPDCGAVRRTPNPGRPHHLLHRRGGAGAARRRSSIPGRDQLEVFQLTEVREAAPAAGAAGDLGERNGFGESALDLSLGYDDYVAEVLAVLDHLGVDDFAVMAISAVVRTPATVPPPCPIRGLPPCGCGEPAHFAHAHPAEQLPAHVGGAQRSSTRHWSDHPKERRAIQAGSPVLAVPGWQDAAAADGHPLLHVGGQLGDPSARAMRARRPAAPTPSPTPPWSLRPPTRTGGADTVVPVAAMGQWEAALPTRTPLRSTLARGTVQYRHWTRSSADTAGHGDDTALVLPRPQPPRARCQGAALPGPGASSASARGGRGAVGTRCRGDPCGVSRGLHCGHGRPSGLRGPEFCQTPGRPDHGRLVCPGAPLAGRDGWRRRRAPAGADQRGDVRWIR